MGVLYSDDERTVLNYFFTNLDKPIFFAKNFHPEVWALMQARYSRSKIGMREGFLKLLKEDPEVFNALLNFIKNNGEFTVKTATDKAIKFMEKWVLAYGHSSVAEGAVVGIALEGVSILATKVIEDNRLCSFCEKSTRYVSFGRDSFYIPEELKNSKHFDEINTYLNELFDLYMEFHEPVLKYIKSQVPQKPGQSDGAYNRSCAARRFDAIRYILPAATMTSLGWTVNARMLAHAISKLKSHPLKEMRDIGDALKDEGKKVLPSLLKYADEKEYFVETEKDLKKFSSEFFDDQVNKDSPSVVLVKSPVDLDDDLITAILYKHSNKSYISIKNKVKNMSFPQKEKIYNMFLEKRGDHDSPLREFEHAPFTWDILMDYGAFRDLQRHRICTQTNQLFTTLYGFDVPDDIVGAGLEQKYSDMMKKANELYKKIAKDHPYSASYIVPLAFKKRFLLTNNLRSLYYLIKLRSTPQGHISYRKIVTQMYKILKSKFPLATKYLVCHMSDDELGRLKQEEKYESKLNS